MNRSQREIRFLKDLKILLKKHFADIQTNQDEYNYRLSPAYIRFYLEYVFSPNNEVLMEDVTIDLDGLVDIESINERLDKLEQ